MAATDLKTLLDAFLAACAAAVATAPGGPISRRFVTAGQPAFDCTPQLTVHAGGPAEAVTQPLGPQLMLGHRTDITGAALLVPMTATVLRCVPTFDQGGTLPSIAEMEAAAAETLGDVWAIFNYVRSKHRQGLLFTRPDGRPREMLFDPAYALVPTGAVGGWQIPIRVQIDGYDV